MKKILLAISRCFANFLAMLSICAFLILYVMFAVPIVFWIGNMTGRSFTDNFGAGLVNFLENDYWSFFFLPFLPLVLGFLLLSVFIWVFYRRDREASNVGFKNTILGIITIFLLVVLPVQADRLGYKIQDARDRQISELYDTGETYINRGFNKEFFKLYQSLADEGLQAWRKDPLAVAKNELEKGDLTYLSHGQNELSLKTFDTYQPTENSRAVVLLKNERLQAEIYLGRYWESPDGVWLVKSYKILAGDTHEKK